MMKLIPSSKNALFVLTMALVVVLSSLFVIKGNVNELRKVHELKLVITDFVSSNNNGHVKEADVNLLAREIYTAGRKYNIDPMLIFSVITVESSLNKNAVSPMGARGLMQLLPATAKSISEEMGVAYNGHKALNDVRTNITLGTYYLSKLSERYNNDMKLYLAAYNYGPDEVDRMIKEDGGIPNGYSHKIIKTYNKLNPYASWRL
ncbi:MAG: lytic transglycosylase domain-containing protein [Proteobacteria bacterium]|nr:lytic transglycosylase domain-containing protein [Pseudomonadota bacterium]